MMSHWGDAGQRRVAWDVVCVDCHWFCIQDAQMCYVLWNINAFTFLEPSARIDADGGLPSTPRRGFPGGKVA